MWASALCSFCEAFGWTNFHNGFHRHRMCHSSRPAAQRVRVSLETYAGVDAQRDDVKSRLLDLIASTPSNMPTSKRLTDEILDVVRQLEESCPTPDEQVVESLTGNWELLWTAQDQRSDEWSLGPLRTWIK